MRWLVVLGTVMASSCGGADDDSSDSATTEGFSITIEQCDELLTAAECAEAVVGDGLQDKCIWFDVRVPGQSCSSDAIVPQCVGMSYVGLGCQPLPCSDGGSVDGFFRTVDGAVEVLANPATNCGLMAVSDGWSACVGTDVPADCDCLCTE